MILNPDPVTRLGNMAALVVVAVLVAFGLGFQSAGEHEPVVVEVAGEPYATNDLGQDLNEALVFSGVLG